MRSAIWRAPKPKPPACSLIAKRQAGELVANARRQQAALGGAPKKACRVKLFGGSIMTDEQNALMQGGAAAKRRRGEIRQENWDDNGAVAWPPGCPGGDASEELSRQRCDAGICRTWPRNAASGKWQAAAHPNDVPRS